MDYKSIVLSALDTMRLGELAASERFKAAAYKKAIDTLKRMDGPLTKIEDIAGLEGIGKKIHEKIVEILATGALQSANRMAARTDVGAMEELLAVHGIGPAKARILIAAGIQSIADLRTRSAADKKLLTSAQKLGLKYYEDGKQRIPRAEMVKHEAILLAAIADKAAVPSSLQGSIVGSYRRGAANSGDIDMLLTYKTSEADASAFLSKAIESFTNSGYVIDTLVSGAKKWMGYVRLNASSTARRLDIMITPPEEYAYAILYFTGSDKFNIAFRKHCLSLGYSLNEHTLSRTDPSKPAPGPMSTEEDIFKFVSLKYIPPTERVDQKQIIPLIKK